MKKLFLIPLIAMSFAQNVNADCTKDYEDALGRLAFTEAASDAVGTILSAGGIIALTFAGDAPVSNQDDVISGAAAAVVVGTGIALLSAFEPTLNDTQRMVSILKEARIINGLEIQSLVQEINNSIDKYAPKSEKVTAENISNRINELNDNDLLCTSSEGHLVNRDGLLKFLLFTK